MVGVTAGSRPSLEYPRALKIGTVLGWYPVETTGTHDRPASLGIIRLSSRGLIWAFAAPHRLIRSTLCFMHLTIVHFTEPPCALSRQSKCPAHLAHSWTGTCTSAIAVSRTTFCFILLLLGGHQFHVKSSAPNLRLSGISQRCT